MAARRNYQPGLVARLKRDARYLGRWMPLLLIFMEPADKLLLLAFQEALNALIAALPQEEGE